LKSKYRRTSTKRSRSSRKRKEKTARQEDEGNEKNTWWRRLANATKNATQLVLGQRPVRRGPTVTADERHLLVPRRRDVPAATWSVTLYGSCLVVIVVGNFGHLRLH